MACLCFLNELEWTAVSLGNLIAGCFQLSTNEYGSSLEGLSLKTVSVSPVGFLFSVIRPEITQDLLRIFILIEVPFLSVFI